MADFSWLRLGQHSHVPNTPRSPAPSERAPSRVPSYLSLKSRSSISPEPLDGSTSSLLVREHDKIWYNPSLEQMVEALQVIMLTKGVLQPIPIEYNSYVLHLIEGFASSQKRIRAIDTARAETKHSLEQHLEHFKLVADEWLEREGQYKSEIKRLEVLLSRTSRDGLEAVTLARTNSVVDRNGPQAKKFVSTLKRLSTHAVHEITHPSTVKVPINPSCDKGQHGSKPAAKILDNDNDFLISEKIRLQDDAAAKLNSLYPNRRQHAGRAIPVTGGDALAMERVPEKPTGPADDIALRPLFLDDVFDTSDQDGSPTIGPAGPMHQEKHARRQILEDLLNCEEPSDRGRSTRPRLGYMESHPDNFGGDRTFKGTSTHKIDSEHLRSVSAFSFVPGDDTSPLLVGGGVNSGNFLRSTNSNDSDDSIEQQQCGQKSKVNPINQAGADLVDNMAIWQENRLPESKEGIPTHGSTTSSVETLIQTVKETIVSAAEVKYDSSPGSVRIVPSISPGRVKGLS
ncbi:hypothetical protein F5Y04DRAFT_291774 [Hypomontagnella monticulosa]|nr:hypothetical protein F5Y04DRAFT_291774 [Hypomontagnella monticulosa]